MDLSDESFFPHPDWLNQFRLRSAYGASGVQPGGTVALQTFASSTANVASVPGSTTATDSPGLLGSALNRDPQARALDRVGKRLRVERAAQPRSLRFDVLHAQDEGRDHQQSDRSIVRRGRALRAPELGLRPELGHRIRCECDGHRPPGIEQDINLSMSHNNNKILNLGIDPSTGKARTNIGTGTTRDSVGLPINAWIVRPFTYTDANKDGIITPDEVTPGAGFIYYGYSNPRDIIAITNGVDLFQRHLRLSVLADYKGGYNLNNASGSFYATNFATWYSENLKSTPLWDQARNVAASSAKNPATAIGYAENGAYWRLREVSAAWTLPKSVSDRMRSRDAQIVFSARNLHTWTKYTGVDPEANYGATDVRARLRRPPRAYFNLRANLHY